MSEFEETNGIITQGEHEVVTEIFKCTNLSHSAIEEIVRRVEIDTGFKINMNLSGKASKLHLNSSFIRINLISKR